jgi:cytochrome d ubiquinol oxidase subunit II
VSTAELLAAVMVTALVIYVLFGGADFGGGVWDLLASGPRRDAQRELVEHALGPIWEANHVWLILVVVLLFSCFPPAFAAISVALHVPLTLLLLGIVLRGSAFTFRAYDARHDARQRRWGLWFSLASVAAPLLLGDVAGALASGSIRVERGVVTSGFFASWLAPFPIVAGVYALVLVAFLAAVYLANEASTPELADDFRRRALASGLILGGVALAAFALSASGAPRVREGLTARPWTWPLHLATGASAVLALASLWKGRLRVARAAAAVQCALVVLGWAASQAPYFVVPDVTLEGASGDAATQRLIAISLGFGALLLLLPSLYVLYRVFKHRTGASLWR